MNRLNQARLLNSISFILTSSNYNNYIQYYTIISKHMRSRKCQECLSHGNDGTGQRCFSMVVSTVLALEIKFVKATLPGHSWSRWEFVSKFSSLLFLLFLSLATNTALASWAGMQTYISNQLSNLHVWLQIALEAAIENLPEQLRPARLRGTNTH